MKPTLSEMFCKLRRNYVNNNYKIYERLNLYGKSDLQLNNILLIYKECENIKRQK